MTADTDNSIAGRLNQATPPWIEQTGWITKLQTTAGNARIETLARCIPHSLYQRWIRAAVAILAISLLGWLALLGVIAGSMLHDAALYILSLEWLTYTPPPDANISLEETIRRAIQTAKGLGAFYVFYLVLFACLVPGLVLHEFGHVLAAVHNDIPLEGYGFLFLGPVPLGGFVKLDTDHRYISPAVFRKVVSGGIINNVLWGTSIIAVSVFVIATTPNAILMLFEEPASAATPAPRDIVAVVLAMIGALDIVVGTFNALPIPYTDGGHYLDTVLVEWWGFNEAVRAHGVRS